MSKFLSKLFNNTLQQQDKEIFQKRLIEGTLFGVGSVLVSMTLLAPKQPKQLMVYQLLTGGVMSLSALAWSKSKEELEGRYKTFLAMNKQHDQLTVKLSFANEMDLTTVAYETDLSNQINELPPGAQARYQKKFGLDGLVIPPNFKSESKLVSNSPGILSSLQSGSDLDQEVEYDTSWITSEFIKASKIVVGAKGSGKSTYLRYEAARWLKENPEGKLLIFDPHYDVDDPSKAWLKDLDQKEIYRCYIFKTVEDIKKQFLNAYAELNKRIKHGLKDGKPWKCIFDEIENNYVNFDEGTFKLFQNFVNVSQNEGRKFLFDVSLGMHSLKEKNTGMDSDTLTQMEWLLFEKAAYSSTTKYPSDFDSKTIRTQAQQLKGMVEKDKCKVIVVIRQEEPEPLVTLLPYLEPPKIYLEGQQPIESDPEDIETELESSDSEVNLDYGDRNEENVPPESQSQDQSPNIPKLYQVVKAWFIEYRQKIGEIPSAEKIKLAWETATGKELTESALIYLIEKLIQET
jgi:hypothetical protein